MKPLPAIDSPMASLVCEKEVYDAMFTDAPMGICLMDAFGRFTDVNESCSQLLGYSRDEMIGMTFQQITMPQDVLYDTQMLNRVIRGEIEHYAMIKRYIDKTGKIIWAQVSMRVILDDDGQPKYMIKHIMPRSSACDQQIPAMRVGELFRHKTTRSFMFGLIGLILYSTIVSTLSLIHVVTCLAGN